MIKRIGLVGTGIWAAEVHARAILADPSVQLAGVWGRSEQGRARIADEFGVVRFDDFESMIEDVDIVAFAIPPNAQASLAVTAARKGKLLLLEKPIALDLDAALGLQEAVVSGGASAVVFTTHSWLADTAAWIESLSREGQWDSAFVEMTSNVLTYDNPFSQSRWRHQRGALWDLGPHALSILIPVLGRVVKVVAMRSGDDTTHITARHTTGALSSVVLGLRSRTADRYRVEFRGREHVDDSPFRVPTFEDCRAAYRRALGALVNRSAPNDALADAVHVVAVLEAVGRAAGDGRQVAVTWPPDDHPAAR